MELTLDSLVHGLVPFHGSARTLARGLLLAEGTEMSCRQRVWLLKSSGLCVE
jgi:hypothetical protein